MTAGAAPAGYRFNLVETMRGLAVAALGHATLAADDLSIVLSGRRAVLELATAVHLDLASQPRDTVPLAPYDFEVHPVQALGRALNRYPRPPGDLSPIDVALATPASHAGAGWQRVARHAVVAHHAWTSGIGAELDPEAQWAGIAEAASLAEALARLDPGLIVLAASSGRPIWARAMEHGLHLAMGVAAREVLRLAAMGPLPEGGPDREPVPQLQVIQVSRADDVPAALKQLAVLLRHGGLVRPERVPLLTGMLARACDAVADAAAPAGIDPASQPGSTRVARSLRIHARALRTTQRRRQQAVSLDPGDRRVVAQAGEIHRAIRDHADQLATQPELLAAAAAGLAETTRALTTATTRSLRSGEWLVVDEDSPSDQPLWRTRTAGDPVPDVVDALRRAAADSVDLTQAVETLHVSLTQPGAPAASPRTHVALAPPAGLPAGLALTRPRLPTHRPVMEAVPRSR